MYSFKNDYSEGAHPSILQALTTTNMVQEDGYGEDSYSIQAKEILREKMAAPDCHIHFIPGGTLTNLIAISSALRPHEACIAASSGHIATHETGAIEATGHKIIEITPVDGKLSPDLIEPALKEHHFEHMVKPRMVYISQPTELGTLYSKEDLENLHNFCVEKNLLLYCDGARLGMALMAGSGAPTLKDMAQLTDAFFIGGAKVGALIGEALVIINDGLKDDMLYMIKQKGGLLSKGRLMGIQFLTLFEKDLYCDLADHANKKAQEIACALKGLGCRFLVDSPSNQIFPILNNEVIEALSKKYSFYIWQPMDESYSAIRLITSWATKDEAIISFIDDCRLFMSK